MLAALLLPVPFPQVSHGSPDQYVWAYENRVDQSVWCFKWTGSAGPIDSHSWLSCSPDNATSVGTPLDIYCNAEHAVPDGQWCTLFHGDSSKQHCVMSGGGQNLVAATGQNGTTACDQSQIKPRQVGLTYSSSWIVSPRLSDGGSFQLTLEHPRRSGISQSRLQTDDVDSELVNVLCIGLHRPAMCCLILFCCPRFHVHSEWNQLSLAVRHVEDTHVYCVASDRSNTFSL